MTNVLNRISGLSNAKVVFVSEMAEFDLDSTVSIDAVLPRIEKESGFKICRITSRYQHLDVLMSQAAAEHFETDSSNGVVSVEKDKKKKKTFRITYDPRIIGARSLLPPDAVLAPPAMEFSVAESRRHVWNTAAAFGVSAALTIPVVVLEWSHDPMVKFTGSFACLLLATLVQVIAIPRFYVPALKALIYSRVIEMDMLVVLSITAAYLYSVVAFALTIAGVGVEQKAFFETSTLLITLVLLGRLVSTIARIKAVTVVSLRSLQAETALLIQPDGETTSIDARLLQFGDVIRVLPHSRVVTDGKVIAGESAVNESMVTGESALLPKQAGDLLIAGTVNNAGTLDLQLQRLCGANSITDIANLVENALGAKPRVQDLADRVASYFISAVLGIAVIVFVIHLAIAIKVQGRNAGGAVGVAITYAIAVLAISCPCALGLAVPMVLVIAGGVAARAGIIIKAADATERGFKTTDVVFDKTGTLTKGDLQVVYTEEFQSFVGKETVRALTKCLVASNDHPVSVTIASHLADQPTAAQVLENFKSIPGAGIQAQWQGSVIKGGSAHWLGLEGHADVAQLLDQSMTCFCVTLDDELLVAFGLKSTLREEAASVIAELQRRKITCHIVSGDAPKVVEAAARTLGVDLGDAVARSSPAEKQRYVQTLQDNGKKVLFCGDGTNDAVAVAQADVGVQIGSTSDVTGAVADVVLLGGLDGVVTLLDVSKRAYRRIRFNFIWTAMYNFFAIMLAAGAFVKFRIPPAYAGLGEIVSITPVMLAAASLALGRKVGAASS
ncbi:hypothetical protein LTR36_007428 [Oleoguttula mirabilis]|uniref:Uncharacterized protein n=1 Tax=Oleoguttula mirabilis TaxID=1507867 RepID=A0AAV9J9D9_9PEZI|nr:hypothetical protein LTR36_007428 [Oleoguttula mirabilis]